jgi:hypothetical protein
MVPVSADDYIILQASDGTAGGTLRFYQDDPEVLIELTNAGLPTVLRARLGPDRLKLLCDRIGLGGNGVPSDSGEQPGGHLDSPDIAVRRSLKGWTITDLRSGMGIVLPDRPPRP